MIYNNLYYSDEKDILDLKDKSIVPVIPVNCKGVMGAGLALQFKNKYPNLFNEYVEKPMKDYNINYNFYIAETNKILYAISTGQLTLF